MPNDVNFRSPLLMDQDVQYLGNSPGDDGRGRLHVLIANKISEPLPVSFSGTIAVALDHNNDSVAIWGTDGLVDRQIKTNASGQIEIGNWPATVAVTQSTSPWVISGDVNATQAGSWTVSVDNFPAIQPVSQSGVWSVGRTWALDFSTDSVLSVQGGPWSVDAVQSGAWTTGRTWTLSNGTDSVAAVQSGSWDINNITGIISLPTGAATAANQATEISSLASIDGKLNSLGQKAMAGSVPVAIASDQSPVPVSQSGTWTVQQGTPPWSVSQSGTWTVGRTWSLASGTDNVTAFQGTSPWVVAATIASFNSSAATLSNVASSATNVTLLASNASRKGFKLYNDSKRTAFIKFGTTASVTSFTLKMVPDSYYEDVAPFYEGQIDAIWDVADGSMRITELT